MHRQNNYNFILLLNEPKMSSKKSNINEKTVHQTIWKLCCCFFFSFIFWQFLRFIILSSHLFFLTLCSHSVYRWTHTNQAHNKWQLWNFFYCAPFFFNYLNLHLDRVSRHKHIDIALLICSALIQWNRKSFVSHFIFVYFGVEKKVYVIV